LRRGIRRRQTNCLPSPFEGGQAAVGELRRRLSGDKKLQLDRLKSVEIAFVLILPALLAIRGGQTGLPGKTGSSFQVVKKLKSDRMKQKRFGVPLSCLPSP
jgi:hypothetical protein